MHHWNTFRLRAAHSPTLQVEQVQAPQKSWETQKHAPCASHLPIRYAKDVRAHAHRLAQSKQKAKSLAQSARAPHVSAIAPSSKPPKAPAHPFERSRSPRREKQWGAKYLSCWDEIPPGRHRKE